MFGMLMLQASIVVLIGVIIVLIRNHFRKVQVHKRILDQIKEENEIWNKVLKQKDINKI